MKKILVLLACITSLCFIVYATEPECPTRETAYFPNADDITTYYECIEGVAYLMSCPPGLGFDPVEIICKVLSEISDNSDGQVQSYCRCKHDGCFAGNKYSFNALCGTSNCPDHKSWCY